MKRSVSSPPRSSRAGDSRERASYELIESRDQLLGFCTRAEGSSRVAVDTEFIGENTYVPVLELIQVADGLGNIGLIDVRAVRDVSPLGRLIGNPERVKIFHSAKLDVFLLERALGVVPRPSFDTQLAAAMVGIGAQVSYVNLVRGLLDVHLKGAETISDWSKRPLSDDQLVYAAQDVQHLHLLHDKLVERVKEVGRGRWLEEEQERRMESYLEDEGVPDEERYHAVKDWVKLNGLELAVLRELASWREREARKRNLSRRLVLSDEGLVMLARKMPSSREEVGSMRRVSAGQLSRYLDDLLEVIRRARNLPREQWPQKRIPKRPYIPEGLVELFQAIVRATAVQESIAANLLSTRDELATLAIHRRDPEVLDLPVLRGWRREMIGEKLLALVEGRMHLRLEDGDRVVIDEK